MVERSKNHDGNSINYIHGLIHHNINQTIIRQRECYQCKLGGLVVSASTIQLLRGWA